MCEYSPTSDTIRNNDVNRKLKPILNNLTLWVELISERLGNILDTLQIYICIMTVVNLSYMIGNIDS